MKFENDIANLKFLYCKIPKDDSLENCHISDFKEKSEVERSLFRGNIYCPDCEQALLTYVNSMTPYFRTKRGSSHSDHCGKAVRSTIENIDDVNEDSVEKLLNRIIEKNTIPLDTSDIRHKSNSQQKSVSKYKSKSLDSIGENDYGLYYCYYARNVRLNLNTNYLTYNYVRIYRQHETQHFLSIEIRKEYFNKIPRKELGLYDVAFFGRIEARDSYKDVHLDNPRFLKVK
jgi:hypothetical protein